MFRGNPGQRFCPFVSQIIYLSKCFNKALAVDAECADAFVGRGAACAGMRNFEAALQDFDKVKIKHYLEYKMNEMN